MSSSDPSKKPRPGPWPPAPDAAAMPPSSWAKRTGFRPKFSGETNASDSGQIASLPPPPRTSPKPRQPDTNLDLEAGRPRPIPTSNGEPEVVRVREKEKEKEKEKEQMPPVRKRRDSDMGKNLNGQATAGEGEWSRRAVRIDESATVDVMPPMVVDDDGIVARHAHMKYELRDTPGLVPIGLYGFQHYFSMLCSLILIPLVIVPAMGGTYVSAFEVNGSHFAGRYSKCGFNCAVHVWSDDTIAYITWVEAALDTGPSFIYLAPVLAIINSPEFLGLNGNNFRHIMKELQGAIIIGSAFQALLGYSGMMRILLRLINPVVVSPTIAAVGLCFYNYGFPRVGTCIEIGVVQILLVVLFSLYLRKISILGHRVFLIYAVPLGLVITWLTAFLLTQAGVYSYEGCDSNIPASNIISDLSMCSPPRRKNVYLTYIGGEGLGFIGVLLKLFFLGFLGFRGFRVFRVFRVLGFLGF
ncbi:hypothetical protein ACJIZ3_010503 [Penstemon smallii]|uniref:Uncharacterized protein n=1 Tax=Penstemon smallii TaxID=265156 RepID=A0ABD3UI25_9LAMI